MLTKASLLNFYVNRRKSMEEIAHGLGCSVHKVAYWMDIHGIKRRTISEAIYIRLNPDGHPFHFTPPQTLSDATLFGIGLGLYWGEGNKANAASVRIGNTDPKLLKTFLKFLSRFFHIRKSKLRFGLQVFTDIDPERALRFWTRELNASRSQFFKPVVTKSGSIGTYRKKSEFGVVTIHFGNKELRYLLGKLLPT